MLKDYPKEISLKSGEKVILRPMVKEDEKKLKILKSLGLPYSEISKLTGIPEGTLKTWDFKQRKIKTR